MFDLHPEAADELQASIDWYKARSPAATLGFLTALDELIADIEAHPERRPADAYGCRKIRLLKYPFEIIYRLSLSGIRIVAVAHTSRRPGYWRHRQYMVLYARAS
jgi:plasmid stabilization system protein ParE